MRIAQISPLFEAVPPKLYGGTERVVYSLTEELVAMGHDVTLFASGDSVTSATLAPMREQALRLDPTVKDWVATYYRMVEMIYRRKDEFDVLHFHIDYFPLALFSRQNVPYLTTIHGRLDLLADLEQRIARDLETAPAHVMTIFLGDYIDRGPDSAGVIADLRVIAEGTVAELRSIARGLRPSILDDLGARGITIILVTHSPEVAAHADRIVEMSDGRIA